MAAQYRLSITTSCEKFIPGIRMNRRHVESCGIFREGHGVASLFGQAPNLSGRNCHVEQRQDTAWNEPLRRSSTPFIDMPIVVCLDHYEIDSWIGTLIQHLP